MLDFTNRPTLTLSVPPGGATMLITTSSDYGSVAARITYRSSDNGL